MQTTIKHKRTLGLVAAFAGLSWASLFGLIFLLNAGDYTNFWFPARVLTYVLLLIAPTLTFMPLGRAFGATFYGWWSLASWAVFGFVFTFLSPDPTASREQNLGALVLLLFCFFAALTSLFVPVFYGLGSVIFKRSNRTVRYDLGRAIRESVLLSIYLVFIAFQQMLGILNFLYAALLLLIALVLEMLLLSRERIR